MSNHIVVHINSLSYFPFLKQEWLYTTEKKQNATKPSENPVLLVKDIIQKTGKLDRELMYLLNKAKYYVPKTKPAGNDNFMACSFYYKHVTREYLSSLDNSSCRFCISVKIESLACLSQFSSKMLLMELSKQDETWEGNRMNHIARVPRSHVFLCSLHAFQYFLRHSSRS